jgi:hypothetical protein
MAVLALAAGTALASSPSPSPVQSARTSPSAAAATAPASTAGSPARASEAPEASEKPEASEAPEAAEAPDSPPSAADVASIVGKLKAAGITTTAAAFQSLAAKVGVGGAVRTLAFAQASGKTPAQILALFQGGKGWGQIDHELGLSIGPGIGWIMGGGHGHGKPGSH